MAPTHTPAIAGVRPRPATPPQMRCEGQERHPGGLRLPSSAPTPRRNKGGRWDPQAARLRGEGWGGAGDSAALKPGGWRGAHSSGAGSCSAGDFRSGLGLRSVSARAQVSHTPGPQRRRFPAQHAAASESRGPGGAAQGRSCGVRAERPGRGPGRDPRNLGLGARPQSLKPLLEKRRRARINASLRQLKGLILPLLGREVGAGALGGRGGGSGAQRGEGGWAEGPLPKEPARGLRAAPGAEPEWGWLRGASPTPASDV